MSSGLAPRARRKEVIQRVQQSASEATSAVRPLLPTVRVNIQLVFLDSKASYSKLLTTEKFPGSTPRNGNVQALSSPAHQQGERLAGLCSAKTVQNSGGQRPGPGDGLEISTHLVEPRVQTPVEEPHSIQTKGHGADIEGQVHLPRAASEKGEQNPR